MKAEEIRWTEILVCPKCQGDLSHDPKAEILICEHCKLAFRVTDGIPCMLLDEAEAIND